MTDHIVSRDTILARARAAHAKGLGRDDHHMPWHSAARDTWQAEWDRCEAEKAAKASPASHGAAGPGKRAELAQGSAAQ